MDTTPLRLRSAIPALLLAAGLGLTGCSSSDSGESGETSSSPMAARDEGGSVAESEAETGALGDADMAADAVSGRSANQVAQASDDPGSTLDPSIIQTGTITVESDDVAAARFDLDKVVDGRGGSIADEKTTATSEGEVRLSRLVLRVPSEEFDGALTDLAALGKVTASTRKAQDVTGEVIDTRARIRAQEQSLARVEVLFGRAQDIRDIVAIEAQLSRRQAELDSLKGQLAYLEDQAALSTITVYLEAAPEDPAPPEQDDDNAFVGGLKGGWHALSALGAGLAAVSGALLPFVFLGVLLGVPASVVARRWLARHPFRRPTAEA